MKKLIIRLDQTLCIPLCVFVSARPCKFPSISSIFNFIVHINLSQSSSNISFKFHFIVILEIVAHAVYRVILLRRKLCPSCTGLCFFRSRLINFLYHHLCKAHRHFLSYMTCESKSIFHNAVV